MNLYEFVCVCVDNLSVEAEESKHSTRFVMSPISDPARRFPLASCHCIPHANHNGIRCNRMHSQHKYEISLNEIGFVKEAASKFLKHVVESCET